MKVSGLTPEETTTVTTWTSSSVWDSPLPWLSSHFTSSSWPWSLSRISTSKRRTAPTNTLSLTCRTSIGSCSFTCPCNPWMSWLSSCHRLLRWRRVPSVSSSRWTISSALVFPSTLDISYLLSSHSYSPAIRKLSMLDNTSSCTTGSTSNSSGSGSASFSPSWSTACTRESTTESLETTTDPYDCPQTFINSRFFEPLKK